MTDKTEEKIADAAHAEKIAKGYFEEIQESAWTGPHYDRTISTEYDSENHAWEHIFAVKPEPIQDQNRTERYEIRIDATTGNIRSIKNLEEN